MATEGIFENTKMLVRSAVLLLFFIACPVFARAEYIETFDSKISLSKDSALTITEDITYVFSEEKHGIYRCIPVAHAEQPASLLRERYISFELLSVQMDGADVPYVTDIGSEWCIKVGDPGKTITGSHRYTIHYVARGTLSYQQNAGADIYWNATGNGWDVPINNARTEVISNDGFLLRDRSCYRGLVGEIASCSMETTASGTTIFSTTGLSPHEGMTIAQSVNRTKIGYDVRERYKEWWKWALAFILILGGGGFTLYRYKTKYDTGRPIIAQYEPYPGMKPMYTGFVMDRRLDSRDITAGIVYLAEQGFLKIRKIDRKVLFFFEVDDYEIELLRPLADITDSFETQIISLLFESDASVGQRVTLNDLRKDFSVSKKNATIFRLLGEGLKENMKEEGYYAGFTFASAPVKLTMWVVIIAIIIAAYASGIPLSILALFAFIFFVVLLDGRRTRKGYEALDHLKGFRDFLSVTEAQRYLFHNAPAINAEHFMEYLPYAIAFGVEKEWAKAFSDITLSNPSWYDGGAGQTPFNAVSLTESLHGFSTALASGTGTSPSSGGGHSGGGSGGGGGGSW